MSLSSFLKENGYEVRTIDLNIKLPFVYKLFKKMLSMLIDLEATIESLFYPFLISLFYGEKDYKNLLKIFLKDRTVLDNNILENNVDWLFNNKLKRMTEDKIESWVKNILDDDPDIVGFSTVSTNFPLSLVIAKEIKRERIDILTILGGANVFWFDKEIMRSYHGLM